MSKEDNRIVPSLRFPEFEKDGSWDKIELGKVADVSKLAGYEFTKHIVYESEGKIIALRGLNIKNNRLDLTDVKYIDNSELSKLERSKLYVDDLMFTYIGTIGEVALIEENNKYYLAPNVSRIRVDKEKIFPKFILHHFNTFDFKEIEIAKYISSSSQPALTMGNVRKFSITIPPKIQEQQKIADCLSSLDKVITAETGKLDLLQDHKKGLLQQLFPIEGETQPKFRFPEFKGDGEWEETTLDEVAKIIMGSSPKSSSYNEMKIGLPLVQGNADIKNRKSEPRIYTSEITKECEIHDILLSVRAPVGTVAKSLHKACIGRGISAIRSLNDYSQEFLYQWLLSFEPNWTNISQGGTFDSVNSSDIKGLALLIPPKKEEQQKIAQCLSAADNLIEAQTQKIAALQEHKKGLLQALFPNIND